MKRAICSATLCAVALTTGILTGCSAQTPKTEPAATTEPTSKTDADPSITSDVKAEMPVRPEEDSLLLFDQSDGAKQLVRNMHDGIVPKSCTVLYDEMGSLPTVTVTDEPTIIELVGLVSQIRVVGPSDLGVTDSYHFVSFTLQNDTEVRYRFEGEGNVILGEQHYFVEGDELLWSRVRELQGVATTDTRTHAIVVITDKDMVESCPTSARAGDTVHIRTAEVLDVQTVVSVTGADVVQVGGLDYEFVMPDQQVAVYVTTEDYEFGGGS